MDSQVLVSMIKEVLKTILVKKVYLIKNSTKIDGYARDKNGINSVNTEEEVDVTCTHAINETNNMSINDNSNYTHKYYAPF